jgi:hypothetical protein
MVLPISVILAVNMHHFTMHHVREGTQRAIHMRLKTCLVSLLVLAIALISNSAWADSITIPNPSNWTTILVDVGRPLNEPATTYSIDLLAGSTLLASMGSSTAYITPGTFVSEFFSYWTSSPDTSQNWTVSLIGSGPQVDFSNLTVSGSDPSVPSSPVSTPEPSPLILMMVGCGLLALLSKLGYSRRSSAMEKTFAS